MTKQAEWQLH